MNLYQVTFCVEVLADKTTDAEKKARNLVNHRMANTELSYYTHVQRMKEEKSNETM